MLYWSCYNSFSLSLFCSFCFREGTQAFPGNTPCQGWDLRRSLEPSPATRGQPSAPSALSPVEEVSHVPPSPWWWAQRCQAALGHGTHCYSLQQLALVFLTRPGPHHMPWSQSHTLVPVTRPGPHHTAWSWSPSHTLVPITCPDPHHTILALILCRWGTQGSLTLPEAECLSSGPKCPLRMWAPLSKSAVSTCAFKV